MMTWKMILEFTLGIALTIISVILGYIIVKGCIYYYKDNKRRKDGT